MFLAFIKTLPCEACIEHAIQQSQKVPQDPSQSAFEYTVTFHNVVNSRLGKPVVALDQALQMYASESCSLQCSKSKEGLSNNPKNINSSTKESSGSWFTYFIVLVILIAIGWLAYTHWQTIREFQDTLKASRLNNL